VHQRWRLSLHQVKISRKVSSVCSRKRTRRLSSYFDRCALCDHFQDCGHSLSASSLTRRSFSHIRSSVMSIAPPELILPHPNCGLTARVSARTSPFSRCCPRATMYPRNAAAALWHGYPAASADRHVLKFHPFLKSCVQVSCAVPPHIRNSKND
jgi:hypothetical protein